MRKDLNLWQKMIVLICFCLVLLYAFKWMTEPEQYWAGDWDYDELVSKDKVGLFKK